MRYSLIKYLNALGLFVFTFLITFRPYYLHQKLNINELGLYLPGIQAIADGLIPYRDFFHLRGPLDLYLPLWCMHLFGFDVSVLSTYFYIGNVLVLVAGIWIALLLMKRFSVIWLMTFILIGRTFPRVVFTFWGGARYVLGFLAVGLCIQYIQTKSKLWLWASGFVCAAGLLLSVEIGVCSGIAVAAAVMIQSGSLRDVVRELGHLCAGMCLLIIPVWGYLACHHALGAYFDMHGTVIFHLNDLFPQEDPISGGVFGVVWAMVNPCHPNFKQLLNMYFYLVLAGVFIWLYRRKKITDFVCSMMVLSVYGFMLFITSFRNVGSSQLEMALMPQIIIVYALLEKFICYLSLNREKFFGLKMIKGKYVLIGLIISMMGSSVGYSLTRYSRRFTSFQYVLYKLNGKNVDELKPLHGQATKVIELPRISGYTLPVTQAEDFEQIYQFVEAHTAPGQTVLMYPEYGSLNFIVDRPFVYKFPKATFSWYRETWHQDYLKALQNDPPTYAVLPKEDKPEYFAVRHFLNKDNIRKFDEVISLIKSHYHEVQTTPTMKVYKYNG